MEQIIPSGRKKRGLAPPSALPQPKTVVSVLPPSYNLTERLSALTRRMATESEPVALMHCVLEETMSAGFTGAALLLTEQDSDGTRRLALHLTNRDDLPLPESLAVLCCEPLFQGEPVILHQVEIHPDFTTGERELFHAHGIAALALLPVTYQGQILGALLVFASEAQELSLHLLRILADFAAIALGNALLYHEQREAHTRLTTHHSKVTAQTQDLVAANAELLATQAELAAQYRALEQANRQLAARATTDGMTGLANHRAFQEELQRQTARTNRSVSPLSLILIDVDCFKQYNDQFGHPAGDEVLRILSSLLRTEVREGDLPARYGGEEFAVILPETDADTARQVAERIRSVVESTPFPRRAVTVSLGVAQYFAPESADTVIQRADVALYEAKSAGRNRAVYVPIDSSDENCEAAREDASDFPPSETEPCDDPQEDWGETRLQLTEEESEADFAAWQAECLEPVMASLLTGGLEGLLQTPPAQVLSTLLDAMDRRGAEPKGHAERVTRYALRLTQAVNEIYEEQRQARPLLPRLTSGDLTVIAFGSLLHDIGKLAVSDSVLRKRGQLSEDEWRQVRRHPLAGAEMLSGNPLLARGLPVVRCHHERWDGAGYPQGLAGEAIPLAARIFAVCDTLESLTSERPYRSRVDYARAREEIAKEAGTQFDPDVVAAFLRVPAEQWLLLGANEPRRAALPEALSHAA